MADPAEPNSSATPIDRHLNTEHLRRDMKGRSVRGGAVTVAAGGISFFVGLGATAVLARLLAPEHFGLIGMVAVIVQFVILFKDMGLSMATVQRAEITHQQVSTLFWINVAISVGTMLVTMAIAPLIALFYGEWILFWIAMANAPGQLVSGLAIQHQALLKRQMRFTALAVTGLIGQITAAGTACVMAWYGFGVWSLVAMPLTNNAVTAVGVWIVCGWRPGRPVRGSGVRPMLRFGGFLTASNLLNYFVRNLDNLLIGKINGAEPLGYYAKAYGLLMMPIRQINAPITAIAVPALSRLQDNPGAFVRFYQKAIGLISFVGMPVVAFSAVSVDSIILTVLGDQWVEAIPLFLALIPAAWIGTFNVATGWVYTSLGTTDRQFRSNVVVSILTCIAFAIGVMWGPLGVAIGLSIVFMSVRLPDTWYCFRGTPLRLSHLGDAIWRPTAASCLAVLPVWLLMTWQPWTFLPIIQLLINCAVYGLSYPLFWLILPGGRTVLIETIGLVKELRAKRAG